VEDVWKPLLAQPIEVAAAIAWTIPAVEEHRDRVRTREDRTKYVVATAPAAVNRDVTVGARPFITFVPDAHLEGLTGSQCRSRQNLVLVALSITLPERSRQVAVDINKPEVANPWPKRRDGNPGVLPG
jgi:hypothetical protein